jgi:PadR family transcriptional regulator
MRWRRGREPNQQHSCYLPRSTEKSLQSGILFIIVEEMSPRSYLNSFELMVLLAVLRLGEDAYGVTISREIEAEGGRQVALGSVYATLDRLEGKGLVTSAIGDSTPERGGRAKRYFHVTRQGLREARQTQRALTRLWKGLPEVGGGAT